KELGDRRAASGKLSGTEINKKGATSFISAKSQGEKKNFRCTPVTVGHNENEAEIEKSLREFGTKELNGRRTETFHKGIRPIENLINESFSGGKPQHNISHVTNVPANVKEGDIQPQILIKQIAEGAGEKLSHGVGRVKIALNPPHLGALHMDIVINDNKVQVILQVENNKVRHVLQLNVEQLKNSLHSQGLIVDNVNVLLQEKSGNTNYGFGQNDYLFEEGKNRGENREDQKGEQDFLSHNSSILEEKESGLQTDARISVFA
ncbi:MAG: flagellar hook-length control protein FliK, partial [Deltaproteobacteria bacterium]|nr:flagellar hook-length control protein FliK [Deltaproteobacteria bacterium]